MINKKSNIDSWPRRKFWLALIALLLTGVAVRLLHHGPGMGSDDQRWILSAQHFITEGEKPQIQLVYFTRSVFLAILALWGQVTDFTVASALPLMLAMSCAATAVLAMTARSLYGNGAGLLTAALYCLHPLVVKFDTYVLPDNLAIVILTLALFSMITYLRHAKRSMLVLSGLLAGLAFGTKQYFILIIVPFSMLVVFEAGAGWRWRSRNCLMIVFGLGVGLAFSFTLQYLSNGDPLSEMRISQGYSQVIMSRDGISLATIHAKDVVSLFQQRVQYIALLLSNYGLISLLMTGGLVAGVVAAKGDRVALLLAGAAIGFLLFLMFMPVQMRPLVLVEMQDRYLMVVLPPLALLTGRWLWSCFRLIDHRAGLFGAVAFIWLGLAWGAWMPANWWDRYRSLEVMAIQNSLSQTRRLGLTEVMLDESWRFTLPTELIPLGTKILFSDLRASGADERTVSWIMQSSNRCAILLMRPPRDIAASIRRETDVSYGVSEIRYGDLSVLRDRLVAVGLKPMVVSVPGDTASVWLARLGINAGGRIPMAELIANASARR